MSFLPSRVVFIEFEDKCFFFFFLLKPYWRCSKLIIDLVKSPWIVFVHCKFNSAFIVDTSTDVLYGICHLSILGCLKKERKKKKKKRRDETRRDLLRIVHLKVGSKSWLLGWNICRSKRLNALCESCTMLGLIWHLGVKHLGILIWT